MAREHIIYALIDPRTQDVRYVGVSIDLETRLRRHKMAEGTDHKSNWIQSLKRVGLSFGVWVLDRIPEGGDWQSAERHWIAVFRELFDLTNASDGGEGTPGIIVSEATRAKLSAAGLGKPKPEGHGDKIRAGRIRLNSDNAEVRARRAIAASKRFAGGTLSEEHRKKVSEGLKRRWAAANPQEQERQIRVLRDGLAQSGYTSKGKPHSPEHVANQVAARRRNHELKKQAALAAGGVV